MWIPAPLYEAIPRLTLATGGLSIAGANNTLMLTSGAMLALCGGLIWKLRRDYRQQNLRAGIQRAINSTAY